MHDAGIVTDQQVTTFEQRRRCISERGSEASTARPEYVLIKALISSLSGAVPVNITDGSWLQKRARSAWAAKIESLVVGLCRACRACVKCYRRSEAGTNVLAPPTAGHSSTSSLNWGAVGRNHLRDAAIDYAR
jgi:hypothetical protein